MCVDEVGVVGDDCEVFVLIVDGGVGGFVGLCCVVCDDGCVGGGGDGCDLCV